MTAIVEILRQVFARHGLLNLYREQEGVWLWPKACGPRIAGLARAVQVRDGVLKVEVSSPAAQQELTWLKAEYLQRLNQMLGPDQQLRDLRFYVGNLPLSSVSPSLDDIVLSEAERASVESLVAELQSERLRSAFRRYLLKARKMAKARESLGWRHCARCQALYDGDEEVCAACALEAG